MKSEISIEKECIRFLIGDILSMPRFKVGFEKVICNTNEEIAKVLNFNKFLSEIRNVSSPDRSPNKIIKIFKTFYSDDEENVINIQSIFGKTVEEIQTMIRYYKENCYDELIINRIDKNEIRNVINKTSEHTVIASARKKYVDDLIAQKVKHDDLNPYDFLVGYQSALKIIKKELKL